MWLPDWLYKLLPYLYVIAGVFTITTFDVVTGHMSGLLLIFTGGIVVLMRLDYRQKTTKDKKVMK